MSDSSETSKPVSMYMFQSEVDVVVPVSRQTLRNWMAKGLFPSPVQLGPQRSTGRSGRVAWLRAEVMEWVENSKERRVSYKAFA